MAVLRVSLSSPFSIYPIGIYLSVCHIYSLHSQILVCLECCGAFECLVRTVTVEYVVDFMDFNQDSKCHSVKYKMANMDFNPDSKCHSVKYKMANMECGKA